MFALNKIYILYKGKIEMKYITFILLVLVSSISIAAVNPVFSQGFLRTDSNGKRCFVGVGYKTNGKMFYQGPMPTKIFTADQYNIMEKCSQTKDSYINLRKFYKKKLTSTILIEVKCDRKKSNINQTSQEAFIDFSNEWSSKVRSSDFKTCP